LLELLDLAVAAGLSLSELAELAKLKAPTTHNFLATLTALGYARQDPATRRYYLGRRAQALGTRDALLDRLREAAAPVLAALQAELRETVMIVCHDRGQRRTLATVESDHALKVGARPSADAAFYTTATGRLLLAHLPLPERQALLLRLGLPPPEVWPGVTEAEALECRLAELRRHGVCCLDRTDSPIVALAAILPHQPPDHPAALGLYYPAARDQAGRRDFLLTRLQAAAEQLATAYDRSS
jgi:DNA-binding IclR family transcriptional regulator